ncbi:hypothetical protein D3C81_1476750 [compost metagenome]
MYSTGLVSTALAATAPLGALGFTSSSASAKMHTPCRMPKNRNAFSYPALWIMLAIGITVIAAPAPNPAAVSPAASPRLSGNHFSALPTQVPYTPPAPMPAITAAIYNSGSVVAYAFITHASPAQIAPPATTGRGPNLSTSQPSSGTSQVSVTMKMENATWIADAPQ